ncbi:MAG TPA: hypothetical protein VGQ06_03810 [Gemmatimonadales bacterium]|jgi:hypothetical protein|nr:hypothetical protein [Gemmatimonadales bacterium]
MNRLLRDYVIAVGSYVGLVALGLALTLTISSAVGYLPYSDRPGPGWTEPSFSLGQVRFYMQWSALLLVPSAIYGTVVFAYLRVLRVFDAPLAIMRVVGALSAGFAALVLAAGVGWYIAMTAFPALVAAGLGAGWGAVLLPLCLGPRPRQRPSWVRWTANSVVLLAGTGGLYWTFLAPDYFQSLKLSVVRVTPSEERLVSGRWAHELEPHEAALLDSVLPYGHLQRVLTGSSTSGDGLNRARMLIVVTAPLTTEARLREPRGVALVYIQRGDRWEMFPPNASTINEFVRVGPGSTPNKLTFAWHRSRPDTFTWAPD